MDQWSRRPPSAWPPREDSADVDELLRHADLALYAAKAAGKRQWRRYLPVLSAGMVRRREVQAALEDAVKNSAFTLAYQPIVALTDGEIAGFEALVRWHHPQWGMMQPGQFIELAEETGHIVPLGSWVLGQAAGAIVQVGGRAPRQAPLYVSVNVSARQFRDPGFVDGVRRVLAESGLAPSALMLELTESVLLRRDERIRRRPHGAEAHRREARHRRFRYRLLIAQLPAGTADRRAQDRQVLRRRDRHLAAAAGPRGRHHPDRQDAEPQVIAEGIETEVQRDLLVSMGCQFGQGYLLAMPVEAADQAEALLGSAEAWFPSFPA